MHETSSLFYVDSDYRLEMLEPESCRVISSANRRVLKLEQWGNSLINIRKRMGPSTLPCGTPIFTFLMSDLTQFILGGKVIFKPAEFRIYNAIMGELT